MKTLPLLHSSLPNNYFFLASYPRSPAHPSVSRQLTSHYPAYPPRNWPAYHIPPPSLSQTLPPPTIFYTAYTVLSTPTLAHPPGALWKTRKATNYNQILASHNKPHSHPTQWRETKHDFPPNHHTLPPKKGLQTNKVLNFSYLHILKSVKPQTSSTNTTNPSPLSWCNLVSSSCQ